MIADAVDDVHLVSGAVGERGKKLFVNAGLAQVLSVTFTPTDAANYTTATATVTIDVAPATPAITWPAPAGSPTGGR